MKRIDKATGNIVASQLLNMDPKEPGAASNAPVEEPAKPSEPQEPGTGVVDASNQPEPKEPASAEGQASQKVGAKPQKPGDEKKSLKERWQEAKALRAAAKKDGKGKDGNILKNFAVRFSSPPDLLLTCSARFHFRRPAGLHDARTLCINCNWIRYRNAINVCCIW